VKVARGASPTYTASYDPQGRSREVRFGHRGRGAKIGPFKEESGREEMGVEKVEVACGGGSKL
jgi:hypothetical protein